MVSWAAAATENAAAAAVDETKTSLMDTNGNGGGVLKHAAVASRNSVGINDF